MSTRSKWFDWKPERPTLADTAQIFSDPPEGEPPKTPKTPLAPFLRVFGGATPGISPKIGADPLGSVDRGESDAVERCTPGALAEIPPVADPSELPRHAPVELTVAGAGLAWGGVRLMALEARMVVSVWSDLDCAELREAIAAFGPDQPFAYLDGPGIPIKYKDRRVPGEPVPMSVLAAMEQNPTEPWNIRDQMLAEMNWCVNGVRWLKWKAGALRRLEQEQRAARKLHFQLEPQDGPLQ